MGGACPKKDTSQAAVMPIGVNKGRLTDEEASKLNHRRGSRR